MVGLFRNVLLFTLFLWGAGWAQQEPEPDLTTPSPVLLHASPSVSPTPTPSSDSGEVSGEIVPVEYATPENTYQNFMAHMALASPLRPDLYLKASRYLDLSKLPSVGRSERGIKLSQQLYWILQSSSLEMEKLDFSSSESPVVLYKQPSGDVVELRRGGDGRWLFSSTTVAAIPDMYDVLSAKGKIETWYLKSLNFDILGMNANLWLALGVLPLIAYVVGTFVVTLCAIPFRVDKVRGDWLTEERVQPLLRPLRWLVAGMFTWLILSLLDIPSGLLVLLLASVKVGSTLAVVVGVFRLSDVASVYAAKWTAETASRLDDMLIPLGRRSVKVLVLVIAFLFLAQNLNIEVWSLFAGFSIFGAMVALAGQDMVKNFFGSITVLADQPFAVGDLIVVSGIEGIVEDVGFRSTRIRTLYDSLVTLPNSQLITASVDNYGRRKFRRYMKHLAIRWDTPPEKVEAFCEGIREIVRQHPRTRKDLYHVWVNDLSDYSLQILLYIFWEAPDLGTELRERHRFLVDLHRLAAELGVEFAYPSQKILVSRRKDQFVSDFNVEQQYEARERGKSSALALLKASMEHDDSGAKRA